MTNLNSILKSRHIALPTKVTIVKAMVFPLVMYRCESWTIRKLCTEELMLLNCGVREDSWESLDCKEIKPVNPKGNQSWIFTGKTDIEAEAPILWPPDAQHGLIGKNPDSWKDWWQKEKGMTEDEIIGWHHQLSDMNLSKIQEMVKDREACMLQSMESQRVRHNWVTELQVHSSKL